jgi:hypothetical protein
MMLLFDLTLDRAVLAQKNSPAVAIYRDLNWRGSDNRPVRLPDPQSAWFLVHATDWGAFIAVRNEMDPGFLKSVIVRFTGGNPADRPGNECWVRYRPVSGTSPFTHHELSALDHWIKSGCPEKDTPWLCLEDQSLYLTGLSILLQLARTLMDRSTLPSSKLVGQESRADTREWWNKHLCTESNWQDRLRGEWRSRNREPSRLLEAFIEWVDGQNGPFDFTKNSDQLNAEIEGILEG